MPPHDPTRAALVATFAEYRRTRDRKLRNELVEAHRPLAVHLARRFRDRGEPFDDLLQVAQVGMMKAVERFDPDRSITFATFATVTINGELKRHFRDHTWAVHVPRGAQELHLRLAGTVGELSQRLGHSPTVPELAQELAVSEDEVLYAIGVGDAYRSASLEAQWADEQNTSILERTLGRSELGFDATENHVLIDEQLASLPERDRRILELRFYDELTQTEIAQRLGVSQMYVSRLLSRTLAELRSRLQPIA